MNHPDDASYKTLFAAPEVVRDLILGFIPDEWLHGLDYATLERVSGSYITDDLRDRADDIVWRVKVGGEWVYLYILIEFQSTVDAWMAVRIMTYVGLLYQDLIQQKQVFTQAAPAAGAADRAVQRRWQMDGQNEHSRSDSQDAGAVGEVRAASGISAD